MRSSVYVRASLGLVLGLMATGCGGEPVNEMPAPPPVAGGPGGGPGPGGPGGGPGGGAGSNPELKQIMIKLGRGPTALTGTIGGELKEATPPWDKIQPQTKEYVQLVSDMAKHEPGKGTKESWTKQVADYLALAKDLDAASQAKDKDKAIAAHDKIGGSCMGCHREHRTMGGPGGGRGGFGGPGGPPGGPGGPPPGGPGGPPGGGAGGPGGGRGPGA